MKYFLFLVLLFTISCAKSKSVLICGNHECINKAEAKQFFEDNLTIEVQIISKDKRSSFDLVDLNMGDEKPNIQVFKNKTKKIVKKLSKDEIKKKKDEIKKRNDLRNQNKEKKVVKKILKPKNEIDKNILENTGNNKVDICQKLEKCDIDSITDYLLKVSNDKEYPNISLRE